MKIDRLIENSDFKSIIIKFVFPFDRKSEEDAKLMLLPYSGLVKFNRKYPTEDEFAREKLNNYIISLSNGYDIYGNQGFYNFELVVPNVELIEDDFLEGAIEFFVLTVYDPRIVNGGFDEREINNEKKLIRMDIVNLNTNLRRYVSRRLQELSDVNDLLTSTVMFHPEWLDRVDGKNLYQFYLDIIGNRSPYIYVFGNVKKEEIEKYLNKCMDNSKIRESVSGNYNVFLPIVRDKYKIVRETRDFKQSSLALIYKVRNMKESDKHLLFLVRALLIYKESNLLDNKLRYEYNMVYGSGVRVFLRYGIMAIVTYINVKNMDKVLSLVMEVMDSLRNVEMIQEMLDKIMIGIKRDMIKSLDSKWAIFDDWFDSDMGIKPSMEEDYKMKGSITAKEIASFMDRLVLETVYEVGEEEHE